MRIERRFTEKGQSPYADIEFRTTTSEIKNPDGSVVFQLRNIDVPADWSQVACDVLAQKYFRKAGVPVRLKPVREADLTVSGQNPNTAVRVTNPFTQAVLDNDSWKLIRRTDGKVAKTLPAREL